jgi:hypothetical protein
MKPPVLPMARPDEDNTSRFSDALPKDEKSSYISSHADINDEKETMKEIGGRLQKALPRELSRRDNMKTS